MARRARRLRSVKNPAVSTGASPPPLYSSADLKRQAPTSSGLPPEKYRSEFRRDYARLIHCPAFRRLQGKAQLFPCQENDFFRNRMSHSLEVAQIAKSIAIKINDEDAYFTTQNIDIDLIEFAGLAHDIGHPPFGHNGESELDKEMLEHGGFEGNAQTLRILTRLEKKQTELFPHLDEVPVQFRNGKDCRLGLNPTYRSLAAILKYDRQIPKNTDARKVSSQEKKPVKGYYWQEHGIVQEIRKHVAGPGFEGEMKTIECAIMDLADDIAYSTYDLEDAFRGGFLSPLSIISMTDEVKGTIVKEVKKRIDSSYSDLSKEDRAFTLKEYNATLRRIFSGLFQIPDELVEQEFDLDEYNAAVISFAFSISEDLCRNGYFRTEFTSNLVGRFIRAVRVAKFNDRCPALSTVRLDIGEFIAVEILKTLAFNAVIMSSRLKSAENRGRWIVSQIFKELKDDQGYLLMPEDWRYLVQLNPDDTSWKLRTISDYVAGMTDAYCIEFYERILGRAAPSIQKQH
jgi:dGTPase